MPRFRELRFEVACFDLKGKAIGRPVRDLLGGRVRERVDFSAYLFYRREGAGGGLGFGVDADARGWAAARQKAARPGEDRRPGAGDVRYVRVLVTETNDEVEMGKVQPGWRFQPVRW